MPALEKFKTVLEVLVLLLFLMLLLHIWRSKGTDHAFGLLTNLP